jgi:DNA-binding CsgD family transcriptional regulator
VALGEDEAWLPLHCWVLLEDSKVLVSFDDAATVARRITRAQEVYGPSPAQVRLARLIVDGHDLAAAADLLAVSVNTLRTQLQRIFDKTGARSQAALVRSLLALTRQTRRTADYPTPARAAQAAGDRSAPRAASGQRCYAVAIWVRSIATL